MFIFNHVSSFIVPVQHWFLWCFKFCSTEVTSSVKPRKHWTWNFVEISKQRLLNHISKKSSTFITNLDTIPRNYLHFVTFKVIFHMQQFWRHDPFSCFESMTHSAVLKAWPIRVFWKHDQIISFEIMTKSACLKTWPNQRFWKHDQIISFESIYDQISCFENMNQSSVWNHDQISLFENMTKSAVLKTWPNQRFWKHKPIISFENMTKSPVLKTWTNQLFWTLIAAWSLLVHLWKKNLYEFSKHLKITSPIIALVEQHCLIALTYSHNSTIPR